MRIQGHQLRGLLAGMGDETCQCITSPCNCAGQTAPIATLDQAGEIFKWVVIGLGVLFILSAMKRN